MKLNSGFGGGFINLYLTPSEINEKNVTVKFNGLKILLLDISIYTSVRNLI
jgi:hypothetical protein